MVLASAVGSRPYTVDALDNVPDDGKRRELVNGQIVEWDVANYEHGSLVALLTVLIGIFVRERRLGQLVDADALVKVLDSDFDARGADIAFYRRERIPADRRASATAAAPDLVIEVLSPTDRAGMVEEKVGDWLRAGVRLLWYVNPQTGVTTVYERDTIRRVEADQALDGGEVLPGFALRMADVLLELADPMAG